MERDTLRLWGGEKAEESNIGIIVYGARLSGGEKVEVVRKKLIRATKEMLDTDFSSYPYAIAPKARK